MYETVEEYAEAHDLQMRDALEILEEFRDELSGMKGRCIDIGCGPGTVTRKLLLPRLPPDARVVGADISKQMIKFADEAQADEERLSFIEFNAEADEIAEDLLNAFDNAVSFYCLNWIFNTKKGFENIYKILRPGGKCLIIIIANHSVFHSYLKMSQIPLYEPYMKDAHKYNPLFPHCENPRETLKKILEESGFEVLHCSHREKSYVYENIEVFNNHMQAVNPFVKRMPEDIRNNYTKDLLREIVSEKISVTNENNGSKAEEKIIDRYELLIAYFKKPGSSKNDYC